MHIKINGSLSDWQKLHELYPAHSEYEFAAQYQDCLKQVGNLKFEKGEGTVVSITNHGLLLQVPNKFMADICLPFILVSKVKESSFLYISSVKIEIDCEIPIHIDLPVDSLVHLKDHIDLDFFTDEIRTLGSIHRDWKAIRHRQKKNADNNEQFDYMLDQSNQAIMITVFVLAAMLIFIWGFADFMRDRNGVETAWAYVAVWIFLQCMFMLHFTVVKEARTNSARFVFLMKHGMAAEAVVTNSYKKEIEHEDKASTYVPCYELTFMASLSDGTEMPIRTKYYRSDRKKPYFSTGQSLNVRYALHNPSLCCLDQECKSQLPVQSIGTIILAAGLISLGLTFWGMSYIGLLCKAPRVESVGRNYMEIVLFMGSFWVIGYAVTLLKPMSLKKINKTAGAD